MKVAAATAVLALASGATACWPEAQGKSIKYTAVPGYFMQDDPNVSNSGFDYVRALGRLF